MGEREMSDETIQGSGTADERCDPVSSQSSHVSDQNRSRFPLRYPSGPRTSAVSIFTGLSQPPTSTSDSPTSDGPSSALSPGSIHRVFPIRSTVSIDPNATPAPRHETSDGFPGMNLGADSTIAARRRSSRPQTQTDTESGSPSTGQPMTPPSTRASFELMRAPTVPGAPITRLDNQQMRDSISDFPTAQSNNASSTEGGVSLRSHPASLNNDEETGLMTARFKHTVTEGGHAVITGRDGETLQRCEDEPIHIPGAVQSFGLLVAFREDAGKLVVRVVSENSERILGYSPAQLFKLDSFLDIFSDEQADNLVDHLDFIRDDEAADIVANGPEVFMVSVRPPHQRTRKLWCAMHITESAPPLVVCEFEIEDDSVNPLVSAVDSATPEPPEDTLGLQPTAEEFAESTSNLSKPLRVLRSARKKRGEAAAMEVFNIMSQVQEQLANAPSLPIFLRVLIGVIKELTGFHRVMVYQFDQMWNGRVVAELVDPRATKDLYKGLNFPASDIPKQARDLYKVNKVRLLYDRDQETARLVCRTVEDLENPVNLTHAYLRAMSPIHIKYLSNMAVRASMSISINAFGELWGLIACHAYGSKGMRVSFPIRKMCRLVGDTASRNIERLSYASRLQARKLIITSSTTANPSGYIVASSEDLLRLFDADSGALSIRDETKIMGNVQGYLQELLALVEFLRLRKLTSVCSSQDIATDFADLRYSPGLSVIAGLLYVPLSTGGTDFIVFLRKGMLQEVKWAGNPYEKFVKEGTEGYLEPRKSFKTWSETIVGRCRDWTEAEIESASVLCLVYGKFIDVWRQKEAALQNSQLTKLLLANSAHEVRTPLNAIINYLEIALEGSLDSETRDNLAKSHSASKSLVYVINDLLDLTKTEDGKDLIKEEVFDIKATLSEATGSFIGDARRKNLEFNVEVADDLPSVLGDHRRVRQVVSNLVANAIQHTSKGHVSLSASKSADQPVPSKVYVDIAVEDTGAGMSQEKVDALFRELEEVELELEDPNVQLLDQDSFVDNNANEDKVALGLGLAVVARTIRNMNGQLRLKTEEGKGSRFVIQLSFDLHTRSEERKQFEWTGLPATQNPKPTSVTPNEENEFVLVNRSAQKPPASRPTSSMIRRESGGSMTSFKSGKSQGSFQSGTSQKSDVDRLIDAIQEPVHLDDSNTISQGSSRGKLRSGSTVEDELSSSREKSKSMGSLRGPNSVHAGFAGQEGVIDSKTPIRAIKLPEDSMSSSSPNRRASGRVLFKEPERMSEAVDVAWRPNLSTDNFSILVAEDDPINSRIIKKRLEKFGHRVYLTVNGEECSSAHGEHASTFDAVLMDLQMPIVDGFSSTKMIRSFEKTHSSRCLSNRASQNGRIPVFAVSASLVENDRERYIETGFDGWILKPIDFKRTGLLLKGIVDEDARNSCLYEPGKWEQGGWFASRETQQGAARVDTTPSGRAPTSLNETSDDGGSAHSSETTQVPATFRKENTI